MSATSECDACRELRRRLEALEASLAMSVAPPTRINIDSIYTPAEASVILRCGKTNVYDLMESGELAVIRTGAGKKGYKVKGSDLILFLNERSEGGPTPKGNLKHLSRFIR